MFEMPKFIDKPPVELEPSIVSSSRPLVPMTVRVV
jgi:hypothetical protein